jgi:hypothetical protein
MPMPGVNLRLAVAAAAVAVFTVMTAGSTDGGGGDPAGVGTAASHDGGARSAPEIRPGVGRQPLVLAESIDSTPTVVAERRRFWPDAVVVPARRPIELTFENRDANSTHSFRLRIAGRNLVALVVDRRKLVLRFASPGPGRYRFVCDIHRAMRGTVYVVRATG